MNKLLNNITDSFILVRKIIYLSLLTFDRIFQTKKPLITVLCYHSIAKDKWRFSVDKNTFIKQIQFLDKNYQFITLKDFALFLSGNKKISEPSILLTFDDGYKNIKTISSFLKSKKISPVLFLIANTATPDRNQMGTDLPLFSTNELKSLKLNGWTFGSHTLNHHYLPNLTTEELRNEVVLSKQNLEKKLGIEITAFAYPRGQFNNEILNEVKKAKYSTAFSMEDSLITKTTNRFIIPRIGIDKTHSFEEFMATISPSIIIFRSFVKKTPLRNLL